MHRVVPNRKKVSNICYNHQHGNHSNLTDSKLPLPPQLAFFWADNLWPYHAKCITQCFNLGDHFPPHVCYEVSDMHLHIWSSILHKGIYLIIIFTLEWYWCIHGYFLYQTQIQNGCHTVVCLTITFKLNFMDSNMTPRFLGLNNFIISIVFMKFRVIFCHIYYKMVLAKRLSALKPV